MERWVVVYDISDDGRRRRLSAVLDDYGDRVQGSVFEVTISNQNLGRLKSRMDRLLDLKADHVRMYPACSACAGKVLCISGDGPDPWWEPDLYII